MGRVTRLAIRMSVRLFRTGSEHEDKKVYKNQKWWKRAEVTVVLFSD